MNKNSYSIFSIQTYEVTPYSDTISKGRCRIFYKGLNRNGSYITDEFAEKLVSTLPYAPVKGIFEDGDYTDHGEERTEGRIYGIAPSKEDLNFAWEKHTDEDGVEREYACADVFFYTGIYKEASDIIGKAQSMELYDKSIQGEWKDIDGERCFVFTDAQFLGLQVLGDGVEPCFEGAAFFSLYNSLKDVVSKLEGVTKFEKQKTEDNSMKIVFNMSDREKEQKLWATLNPNDDEEHGWEMNYSIVDVFDTYVVARNVQEDKFERIYYTRDDENDTVTIGDKEDCFIIDVNTEEYEALKKIREANKGTYTGIEEKLAQNEKLVEENSALSTKKEELEVENATLKTEGQKAQEDYTALKASLDEANEKFAKAEEDNKQLVAERDALVEYKKNVEDNKKLSIIGEYTEQLNEETIASFKENMDNYTLEDLDVQLTYEVKKAHPEIFKLSNPAPKVIPKVVPHDEETLGDILNRYN